MNPENTPAPTSTVEPPIFKDPKPSEPTAPDALVEFYHPGLLAKGQDPADVASITSFEAFQIVWEPKGFVLL